MNPHLVLVKERRVATAHSEDEEFVNKGHVEGFDSADEIESMHKVVEKEERMGRRQRKRNRYFNDFVLTGWKKHIKGKEITGERQVFSAHGDIEEGAVITDKVTGKSRGYGFITYRHMESAQRALREPSKLIDGRLAVCNLACEGLSGGSVSTDLALRKIYIGGLSPEISSEALLKFFGRYGEIEEGSVAYDKETTKSKGFGFVTYKAVDAAKKALDDPNKSLGGRNITVKLADSHKSKVIQTQAPVPLALPFQHGFAQQGKSQAVSPDPVGYASYTHGLPLYPTAYGNAPSGFANQPQTSYGHIGLKNDQPGLPSTTPGVTGYSFYAAKP